jgi:hypothetical protein
MKAVATVYHPLTSAQRKALEDELRQEQELLREDQRNGFQHGVPTKKRVSLLHISLIFVGTLLLWNNRLELATATHSFHL